MQVLREILDAAGDSLLRWTEIAVRREQPAGVNSGLSVFVERSPVERGDAGPLIGVGDDQPVPTLPVRAGWCLQRNTDALFDQFGSTGRSRSSRRRTARVVVNNSSGNRLRVNVIAR